MGPLRGRLGPAFAAALLPCPALAQVCKDVRPFWSGNAPATGWDELIGLMATPPSLGLLVLSALVLRFRSQWGVLAAVVGWSAWISVVALSAPDATRQQAIAEGCIGSPVLFIIVVAAICGAMILYTSRRTERPN